MTKTHEQADVAAATRPLSPEEDAIIDEVDEEIDDHLPADLWF